MQQSLQPAPPLATRITIDASLQITNYEIVGPAFYSNFEDPPTVTRTFELAVVHSGLKYHT
jgi:hypothetical protein